MIPPPWGASMSRGTSMATWPVASVSTVFGRLPLRTFPASLPAGARLP